MRRPKLALALLLAAVPLAAAAPVPPQPDAAYLRDHEAWRKERIDGLKKEDGWFALVGLFWLNEGENRFGTDPGNKVLFPEGRGPAVAGVLTRQGKAVTVRAEPGAGLTHDGKPVTEMALRADVEGEPTVLELGSLRFFVIHRGERVGVRVKDTKSPALAAFTGIDTFPVDPRWRVAARFEPYAPPKQIAIPNVLGTVEDSPSPGALVFEAGGKTQRIDALQESDGSLFLIFADATNGTETYGAGRFLSTEPPKDGKVVVDFNRAYNPPCAFTAFATCPLPPKQNKLALRVEAGEKAYAGGPHH